MTVLLVLTIIMAGSPGKTMRTEVPSLEDCLHESREFLMKADISKLAGAQGMAAACVVMNAPKREDADGEKVN